MFVLVIIGYFLLIIFEYIPLYKQQVWKDFWTNVVFGIISFAMVLLISLNISIPSPSKPIETMILSLFGK